MILRSPLGWLYLPALLACGACEERSPTEPPISSAPMSARAVPSPAILLETTATDAGFLKIGLEDAATRGMAVLGEMPGTVALRAALDAASAALTDGDAVEVDQALRSAAAVLAALQAQSPDEVQVDLASIRLILDQLAERIVVRTSAAAPPL